jgi:hypothetical protein
MCGECLATAMKSLLTTRKTKEVGVDLKFDSDLVVKTRWFLVQLYSPLVRRLDAVISHSDESFLGDNKYLLNQLLINRYIRDGAACMAWSNSLGLMYEEDEDGTGVVFDNPKICLGAVSDHLELYYKEVLRLEIKGNIIRGDFEHDHAHRFELIEDSEWFRLMTSHAALSQKVILLENNFQVMLNDRAREGYINFFVKYVIAPLLMLINIGISLRSI